MKTILPFISYAALLAIIVAAGLVLAGSLERSASNNVLLLATIVWFGTVPFWMGKKES